jgi:DNA-directed RNA polymerase specialized sigma24 family protein
MEYHTIASTLGLSLGNVKTLIHRGKIALAQKMREREEHAQRRSPVKDGGAKRAMLVL